MTEEEMFQLLSYHSDYIMKILVNSFTRPEKLLKFAKLYNIENNRYIKEKLNTCNKNQCPYCPNYFANRYNKIRHIKSLHYWWQLTESWHHFDKRKKSRERTQVTLFFAISRLNIWKRGEFCVSHISLSCMKQAKCTLFW